jgi:hypothetical protein
MIDTLQIMIDTRLTQFNSFSDNKLNLDKYKQLIQLLTNINNYYEDNWEFFDKKDIEYNEDDDEDNVNVNEDNDESDNDTMDDNKTIEDDEY